MPRSSSSASPSSKPASANAAISAARFLSATSRPSARTRTGPPRCPAVKTQGSQIRALKRHLDPLPRHPQPAQPLRTLRRRHDEPRGSGGDHAVHAPLEPRQRRIAPRRELAEHEHRHAPPACPGERPERRRAVLPAHDAIRTNPRQRRGEATWKGDWRAACAAVLSAAEDLATVPLSLGEPSAGLVPAGLARREVQDVRIDTTSLCEGTEEGFAVGDGNRRQDRDARRHGRNFA